MAQNKRTNRKSEGKSFLSENIFLLKTFALVIVGVFFIALYLYYRVMMCDNVKSDKEVYLYIPSSGCEYKAIKDSLKPYLKSMTTFQTSVSIEKAANRLKPGKYKITQNMSNKVLVRRLVLGQQEPVNLVIAGNIRSYEKLAGILSAKMEADSVAFLEAVMNDSIRAFYGFNKQTYFAMFLPNTYSVKWTDTPEIVLQRLNKEYNKFWTDERKAKAAKVGMTAIEVSTLASIVGEETNKIDEMPRVAGVYVNRLNKKMPLQADPTLKFAVGDFTLKRILNIHKDVDSPYNTYKHTGLPPGPIAVPSLKAIDAVLNYEHHNYVYFCAKEDFSGYHNFATTLQQHNENAKRYHKALNSRGIR